MPTASRKTAAPPAAPEREPADLPKLWKAANTKPPKTLAQVADLLYTTRQKRLAIQKEADALAAIEYACREELIAKLPKSLATGVSGQVAKVFVENKTVVSLKDFDKVVAYVAKNYPKNPGVAALIQRRLNDATVKEMWAAGVKVPGVESTDIPVVSCTKL